MARSRIIKPEFWSDEKLAKLSLQARLLYIGLWNTSDDAGTTQGHPLWLKSQIFPYDQNLDQTDRAMAPRPRQPRPHTPLHREGRAILLHSGLPEAPEVQHPSPAKNPAPPLEVCDLFMSGSRAAHEQTEAETEAETETEAEAETETEAETEAEAEAAPRGVFNRFWQAYPKKKSKGQAEKAWSGRTCPTSSSSTACSTRSGRPCVHPAGKRKAANTYRTPPPGFSPAAGRTRQGLQPLPVPFPACTGPFGRLSSRS